MTKKRYRGEGVMEFDWWVEFDESEIPAGMDEHQYARQLVATGRWNETEYSTDFRVQDVHMLDEDAY
jgi:hypothetical protein